MRVICKLCKKPFPKGMCTYWKTIHPYAFYHVCHECEAKEFCTCLYCGKPMQRFDGILVTRKTGVSVIFCSDKCIMGNPSWREPWKGQPHVIENPSNRYYVRRYYEDKS